MTTLYIAGPMSGYPDYNYPAFNDAADRLRDAGFSVLNPAETDTDEYPHDGEPTWEWYMRQTLAMVLEADGLAVLPGWECSRGARLEVDVAHALRLPVKPLCLWLGEESAR